MRRQGFGEDKDHDSDDDFPMSRPDEGPSQATLEGRGMLRDMFDQRKLISEKQAARRGSQTYESSGGNGLKLRAEDLITLTVPEKLEYLANRRKHLDK